MLPYIEPPWFRFAFVSLADDLCCAWKGRTDGPAQQGLIRIALTLHIEEIMTCSRCADGALRKFENKIHLVCAFFLRVNRRPDDAVTTCTAFLFTLPRM